MSDMPSAADHEETARKLLYAAGITGPVHVVDGERTLDVPPGGRAFWSEVHADRAGHQQIAHCSEREDADLIAHLINGLFPPRGMKPWGPDSPGYPNRPADFLLPQGGVVLRDGTSAVHPHRWTHVGPDDDLHPYDIVFYRAAPSAEAPADTDPSA